MRNDTSAGHAQTAERLMASTLAGGVMLVLETLTQIVTVIFISPLIAGIYENLKSKVELKKGPSVFQPYYDLFKYIKKETIVPYNAGFLFIYGPYLVFAILVLISFIIPVVIPEPVYFTASADFLGGALLFSLASFIKILGSVDSGSNYSVMGAARASSFTYLGEATLITVFFAVAFITRTDNPYVTNHYLVMHPFSYLTLLHIFASVAFFMVFLFETGRIPVESEGLMELGMIDGAFNYEYSGKLLAINKWSGYMKNYLLGSVLLNVFIFPWFMFSGRLFFLDVPVMILKWLLLMLILLFIETTLSKLRLYKVQDFLATAFTLSIAFLIVSVI
ncbi:formate hydrogenlyase subunit 4 [Picrophilus oshimae DSM 9789]|uniref:Formate hydrogenlyase subunit 4 n=2 Tax=Picrophilus oshimae TaxID=46632 RepID=Q6L0T8_PICTO|nr:respiratory chain complex I subunit 1 family protein [Picrophilus oshimae]AAT43414.1 formate hydrogenlyase subunit 4 [Picrophilus oshimae DSM 9789]